MSALPSQCSSCGGQLKVSRLSCPGCESQLEGSFELPALLHLAPDELAFVEQFVRASGSLKEMASLRGQSYPTIRSRLDEIIRKLTAHDDGIERKRHKILDAIAKGALSVKEGAKKLKELES